MKVKVNGKTGEKKEYPMASEEPMVMEGLESYGAYQKSLDLFDLVVEDMNRLVRNPLCHRLVGQQVASADSMCSNIEEGYGRYSRKEYSQFLKIARGSAQETRGRYKRFGHWLPPAIVDDRVERCDGIIGILTTTIVTLSRRGATR